MSIKTPPIAPKANPKGAPRAIPRISPKIMSKTRRKTRGQDVPSSEEVQSKKKLLQEHGRCKHASAFEG
jgi:hypothetical protein